MARPTVHDLHALLQIINDNPGLSNRQHARLLGVSEGTVRRAKKLSDHSTRRQAVFLSASQFSQLKAEADRLGSSVSALIGQVLNDYLEKRQAD
jgi:hypothetical protein